MKLDNMTTSTVQGFAFSAVRPETLGATEYTLVTLVLDRTGSVAPFAQQLFEIKSRVVEACLKSPRSDFVLLRVVEFNANVDEVHGFVPLNGIDASQYAVPHCTGSTALYDAVFSALGATNAYAKTLSDQDYLVNALTVIVTDGDDNASRLNAGDVANEIKKSLVGEHLESSKTILVAVDALGCDGPLNAFAKGVGVDEYVAINDASAKKLARLADFVSQSISTTSQAMGTGGPSAAITF